MTSILLVPLSASVYVSSKTDAVPGGYSRHHTRSRLTLSALAQSRLRQEVVVMCTRGPLAVRGFASNV